MATWLWRNTHQCRRRAPRRESAGKPSGTKACCGRDLSETGMRISTRGRDEESLSHFRASTRDRRSDWRSVPTGRGGTVRRRNDDPARKNGERKEKGTACTAIRSRWSLVTPRIRGPHPRLTPRIDLDPSLDTDLGRERFSSSSSKVFLNNVAFASTFA